MTDLFEYVAYGLKCDNCGAEYPDIRREDFDQYVGSKCPNCSWVILQDEDIRAVERGEAKARRLNRWANLLPGFLKQRLCR